MVSFEENIHQRHGYPGFPSSSGHCQQCPALTVFEDFRHPPDGFDLIGPVRDSTIDFHVRQRDFMLPNMELGFKIESGKEPLNLSFILVANIVELDFVSIGHETKGTKALLLFQLVT